MCYKDGDRGEKTERGGAVGREREGVYSRVTSALAVLGTNASISMPDCCNSSNVPNAFTFPSSSTNTRSHMCKRCTWWVTKTLVLSLRAPRMHSVGW